MSTPKSDKVLRPAAALSLRINGAIIIPDQAFLVLFRLVSAEI